MIRAETDDEHQRDAADHTDGLAAATRLFSQMVAFGCQVEFGAQDRITHQDGDHRDDVTQEDCANQHGGNVVNLLKVGVFHTGEEVSIFFTGHRHEKEREGLRQDP